MCPMKLITAHRILITAGIAFFIFYAVVQLRVYVTRGGEAGALVQAVIAAVIGIGRIVHYPSRRNWGQR